MSRLVARDRSSAAATSGSDACAACQVATSAPNVSRTQPSTAFSRATATSSRRGMRATRGRAGAPAKRRAIFVIARAWRRSSRSARRAARINSPGAPCAASSSRSSWNAKTDAASSSAAAAKYRPPWGAREPTGRREPRRHPPDAAEAKVAVEVDAALGIGEERAVGAGVADDVAIEDHLATSAVAALGVEVASRQERRVLGQAAGEVPVGAAVVGCVGQERDRVAPAVDHRAAASPSAAGAARRRRVGAAPAGGRRAARAAAGRGLRAAGDVRDGDLPCRERRPQRPLHHPPEAPRLASQRGAHVCAAAADADSAAHRCPRSLIAASIVGLTVPWTLSGCNC